MTELEFQLVRGVGFGAALAAAVLLQRLSPHARLSGSWRVNGSFWIMDALIIAAVCGACACTAARWAAAREIGLFHSVAVPGWLALVATIGVLDLVSYTWHRANHAIPFLWRFHQVHHSDSAFTVSTALRFHPGELLLSLPLRLAAVVALGATPGAVVTFEILFAVANLIEHGDIDLPQRLERRLQNVCITPALHRLHHSRKRAELNSNFGTIFAVWDRLLGTHQASASARRVTTGLPYAVDASTLLLAARLPFSSLAGRSLDPSGPGT
jgi:sterol desaturase/sphingolipid hydroxylase (fatty acid hydroxylase superfamily)